ncbi:GIY-YIG nuclease family protein [Streptomyces sp. B21-101]|uniref:GIY-YIG nuclease family protein n=1 Tax=Streptomyces sp. B21-101 TaxID=3039415 RepID=UPI002FF2D78C
MDAPTNQRTALEDLYGGIENGDIPPFLSQLYPQFLRYWQYLGTGSEKCRWEGLGYFYVPAECEDAPLNYEIRVQRPTVRHVVPNVRTALYRLRTERGHLLYVGISSDPLRRWPEHAAEKSWWSDVASLSIQWFESRPAALEAEASAIRTEQPIHNVVHNGTSAV